MADREFTNVNGIKVCDQTARDSIPTKTSQLTNDSGYITNIPDEYITTAELTDKGYATTSQIPTVPTNVSEFTNDANYASETFVTNKIAEAQLGGDSGTIDLSGYVTKEVGNASQITFSDGNTLDVKLSNIGNPTDEQIATAVSNYLTKNPIDGSIDTIVETIPDNNLFDKNNLVRSFIASDGSTVNGTFTNYIKLKAGQKYITNLNYTQFYFFDADKNHTGTQTYISYPQVISGDGYVLIKLPSDYSKVKVLEGTDIGAHKPQHIKLKSSLEDNKWYGKKWLLIGDSISTDESNLAKNGYGKLISRELGMTLTNISVSGKVMSWGYEQLDDLSDKFDLVTVMLGTNNQGYNCGIGSLNDSYYQAGTYNSNSSFYAQTQLMIEKLMMKFPKSKIIFLTPIKRTGVGDDASYNDENGYLKKLATTKEYRDVIIDCCNYYSIPCIDLYNCIDPRTEANRTLYFMSAGDGTHPNDLGHALFLAPVIKNGIIKECPYYFNDWTSVETYGDIVTSISDLSINEGGTGTFTVSLSTAPTNDQVVALSSDNVDVTVSPTSLTFTSENYGTAQTVTVSVAEDDDTTNDTATITLSSNGVTNKTVSITATDNDEPTTVECTGITLSASSLSFTTTDAQTLTATVEPSNTTDTISWSVSPTGIATVDNGVVAPVANGDCTITATCGTQTATCTVNVALPQATTTYTITNNLTNCTNSNSAVSVEENASYTATLTANGGYTLGNPTITMGGTDITSTVYSSGNINITSVTGNVVITCNATANSSSGGEVVLLHSYDASAVTDGDTVLRDQTNSFDLTYVDGTSTLKHSTDYPEYLNLTNNVSLGADVPGGSEITTFLLGNTSKDFTIVFKARSANIYSSDFFNTSISNGMNVSNNIYNDTNGRFTIGNGADGTTWFTNGLLAYNSEGILTRVLTSTSVSDSRHTVLVIKYDSTSKIVYQTRYRADNDGNNYEVTVADPIQITGTGLLFHGLYFKSTALLLSKFNIYSGIMSDQDAEALAKQMLGVE